MPNLPEQSLPKQSLRDNSLGLAHPKIMSSEEATTKARAWRAEGLKVVFTNGCFDILHTGHVDLLARAKALGERLIVGLNSDASVRRQGKGPERPINKEAERAFVLAHLSSVDAVVIFDEDTPLNLIKLIIPNVLVKGGDWDIANIVGKKEVEAAGGQVMSLPLLGSYSSTGILQKICR